MNRSEATVKANGLLDYKYQLPMVGLTASDTVIADCGVEYRTPFTRTQLLKFALNSPLQKLINTSIYPRPKYPLGELFKENLENKILILRLVFLDFPMKAEGS